MKIRNGFVSNSSSSSFVVIGARIDGQPKMVSDETWEAFCEGNRTYDLCVLYTETPTEYVIGKVLANDSDSLPSVEVSAEMFDFYRGVVKSGLKTIGIDCEPSLIIGTRPS
jgi:hypothetical protein